jgi:uncharacterized damage-inducible protein DinB
MLRDHLLNLFEFSCWGRDLMLDNAEKLSAEQFDQETRFPIHTVKETLVHTLTAELAYRKRCMGEQYTQGLEKSDFAGVAAIRTAWVAEEKLLRQYLASVTDEELTGTVTYKTSKGDEYTRVRIDLLFQLLFHSMQHRAELAQMLTEFGHSPGNIDYSVYKFT